MDISFLKTEKGIGISLVLIAVLFNAVLLWSEAGVTTYDPNDAVFHLTATQQASLAIRQGLDPNDFWLTQIEDGYTPFYYYQHLPHVILAELDQITSYIIPLPMLFGLSIYILLILVPVSMYWCMRRFEFGYVPAGISALLVSLVATNNLMGIEYSSYIWLGYGLFTQLWAIVFFPLALAETYRAIKGNGSWFWAVLLSSIVLLSHLIYGYMLLVSIILMIFLIPKTTEIYSRLKKTVILFILTGAVTAFFFIPLLLNLEYLNRSQFMDPLYYTSYGISTISNWLVTGNLFDYGRLPVITVLFFISLFSIIISRSWKDEKYRLLLVLTGIWFVIFLGPATFGDVLYVILPFSHNMLYNRFLGGFQFGAVMMIGAGLPILLVAIKKKWTIPVTKLLGASVIILMLVLIPVYLERVQFYGFNTQWKIENQFAFTDKSQEIRAVQTTLDNLPPGRIYAGVPTDFGNDPAYKIGFVWWYSLLPQLGYDTFGYSYTSFGLSSDIRMQFDNTRFEQYDLFNIRYVLLANTWTPAYYYTKLKVFDDYTLYQVQTTGYFDLVDVPAVFYGNASGFYEPNKKWLISPLVAQKQNPLIVIGDTKPNNTLGLPEYTYTEITEQTLSALSRAQSRAGTLSNETLSMNEYSVDFTASRDCYLMLKTSYHPGWSATVDGVKVPTVILSPGFVGVPVTTGTHHADFIYKSSSIRTPLFAFGILTLLVLFVLEYQPTRQFIIKHLQILTKGW
jgi:hypothetical protein